MRCNARISTHQIQFCSDVSIGYDQASVTITAPSPIKTTPLRPVIDIFSPRKTAATISAMTMLNLSIDATGETPPI
tara:strand:+ start:326 stop:553 length:228 start_codon:yes stop_codon:yes gene_type:complete